MSDLRKSGKNALGAQEKDVSVIDVWHGRPAQDDCLDVQCMEGKDAVWYMDMHQRSAPCIHETMANTPVPRKNFAKPRPGAVIHTHLACIKKLSIGGAMYFGISMDEASEPVHAFQMKGKGETAELLSHQFFWVERKSG